LSGTGFYGSDVRTEVNSKHWFQHATGFIASSFFAPTVQHQYQSTNIQKHSFNQFDLLAVS